MKKNKFVYDIEVLGKEKPIFLVCLANVDTGETHAFWEHKRGHINKLEKMLLNKNNQFISFNGNRFDAPLLAAAIAGYDASDLKIIAQEIIENEMMPWEALAFAKCKPLEFNHIDLIDVAPGVMTSLKTYMGRMHYPSLIDLPFHHDHDLSPKEMTIVEQYCRNDIGGTAALLKLLSEEITNREEMSKQYGIDLRSKSDAQIAEAILKNVCGITTKSRMPSGVTYSAPKFIVTKNNMLKDLIYDVTNTMFKINYANGSPVEAEWMEEPLHIGQGIYKFGLGGLHSQHDIKFYAEGDAEYLVSDFDVASYYPSIMLACDYAPQLPLGKGELFLEAYRDIYNRRQAAKKAGDKKLSNTLKIVLNGTFGKLGSSYCSFYSPDLLIAVTLTGQLNLLCLIDDLERNKGVKVLSANTDGIMVGYPRAKRDSVLETINVNGKRTGFEYEETRYLKVAMKDVNNYFAVHADYSDPDHPVVKLDKKGKPIIKTKGLYADAGLMKNPSMEVCSLAVKEYLVKGTPPEKFIKKHKKFTDFLAIRGVTGGGVQHTSIEIVDDWVLLKDYGNKDNVWVRQKHLDDDIDHVTKRKSRPAPVAYGVGGKSFGRVARWYMTTEKLLPITYVKSGNIVPTTTGAKVCMILPDAIPADLDRKWYVEKAYSILKDIGVTK